MKKMSLNTNSVFYYRSEKLHPWFIQQIGNLPLSEIEKKISCLNNVLWKGLRLGENMSNEKCYLWLMFAQILQFESKFLGWSQRSENCFVLIVFFLLFIRV